MGFKDFLERLRNKRVNMSEFEEEREIERKWIDKQKSANERELERFMKEEREDSIKKELEEFRKKRRKDIEFNHQILKVKNMFENDTSKFGGKEILKNDEKQLKGGNMFFK